MSNVRPAAFKRAFASLRTRNYRLFFFGQTVSLAGTWMQDVATAWLVLRLTESPVALGTMLTIRFAPMLALSLLGGVVADRFPKRRLLLIAQAVMLAQALVMGGLTSAGLITVVEIYVLSGIRGLADALDMPTRQAFVFELVGPRDTPNAIALNSTIFNAARVVGPAIGGVLVATVGTAICFYLNALSFLAVLLALTLMRTAELYTFPRRAEGNVLGRLAEGFRYARRTPDVLLVFFVLGTLGTFGCNFNVILPLIARYVVDSGPTGLGAITAAAGFGSLLAALSVAYRARPSRRVLLLSASVFSALLCLVALSRSLPVTVGLLFLQGGFGVVFLTTCNIRLQLLAPAELRGRVMAIYALLLVGTAPFSSLLIGVLAEKTGVQATILEMGALCLLGVVFGVGYAHRVEVWSAPEAALGGQLHARKPGP